MKTMDFYFENNWKDIDKDLFVFTPFAFMVDKENWGSIRVTSIILTILNFQFHWVFDDAE